MFTSEQQTLRLTDLSMKQVKISFLNEFREDCSLLSAYLTQLNLYIKYNKSQFIREHDKVFFTSMYLCEDAFAWFKPTIKDQLKNQKEKQEDLINEIFISLVKFKEEIHLVFKKIDKEWTAEWEIFHLHQKETAVTYVTAFHRVTQHINWRDAALTAQFYKRLKNEVKNEITQIKWSESL